MIRRAPTGGRSAVLQTLAVAALVGIAAGASAQTKPPLLPPRGSPVERKIDPRPNVRPGRVEAYGIASRQYGRERRLWVYTPPDYSSTAAAGYDLMLAFDGGEYLDDIPLPMILDALLADRKTPPFVAVLIDNGTSAARLDDLANRANFAAFLADEVIPWTRLHWNVTHDPRRTIVTGSSAGGLAAAYVAFKRPDLFGNVLSQSGAFWRGNEGSNEAPYEWLTSQYATSSRKDIRFLLEVGSRESRGALHPRGESPPARRVDEEGLRRRLRRGPRRGSLSRYLAAALPGRHCRSRGEQSIEMIEPGRTYDRADRIISESRPGRGWG